MIVMGSEDLNGPQFHHIQSQVFNDNLQIKFEITELEKKVAGVDL